jgi:hypothetical protein
MLSKIVSWLLFLMLATPYFSWSQCNNYDCMKKMAELALESGYYKKALNLARGALNYDYDSKNKKDEINAFIDRVFLKIDQNRLLAEKREKEAVLAQKEINKQKINAELARDTAEIMRILADSLLKKAEMATKEAEKNLIEAKKQTEIADKAKLEIEISLKKYQAVSDKIVNLYVDEVNAAILEMNYRKAEEKLFEAAEFSHATPAFRRAVAEVAFWWNETKQTPFATRLLSKTHQGSVVSEYGKVKQFLKDYEPSWSDTLQNRYFGEMINVEGRVFIFHKSVKAEVSSFSIAQTETTFWQYGLYCTAIGKSILDYSEMAWGYKGNEPIIKVSWYEALKYTNWLSEHFGLVPVYEIAPNNTVNIKNMADGFRLPTETEWEYAAKGGINHQYTKYAGSNFLTDVSCDTSKRTYAVALKKANALGIYDFTGNVWEWCSDWYGSYPKKPKKDYGGVKPHKRIIVRGGAWNNEVKLITRSAYRIKSTPEAQRNDIGFRVAKSMKK